MAGKGDMYRKVDGEKFRNNYDRIFCVCPNGFRFGKDFDFSDPCFECNLYDKCRDYFIRNYTQSTENCMFVR